MVEIDAELQTVTLKMETDEPRKSIWKSKKFRNVMLTIIALLALYVLLRGGEAGEKLIFELLHKLA